MCLEELKFHNQGITVHHKDINIFLAQVYKNHFQGKMLLFEKHFYQKIYNVQSKNIKPHNSA